MNTDKVYFSPRFLEIARAQTQLHAPILDDNYILWKAIKAVEATKYIGEDGKEYVTLPTRP